jgi:hypothetical protein
VFYRRRDSANTRWRVSRTSPQVWNALLTYGVVSTVAALGFYFLSPAVSSNSPWQYLFILLGPAPLLLSHWSLYGFLLCSLFVFPWLLLGGRRSAIGVTGFVVSWVGIGWLQWGPSPW